MEVCCFKVSIATMSEGKEGWQGNIQKGHWKKVGPGWWQRDRRHLSGISAGKGAEGCVYGLNVIWQGEAERQTRETTERVGVSPLWHDCCCAPSRTRRKGQGVKLMSLLFLWCAFK